MRKFVGLFFLIYAGTLFLALMILVCPLIVIATALFKRKTGKRIAFFFLTAWARVFSWLSGIWILSEHRAAVDTSRSYIYTVNHNSFLDAVVVAASIPQVISPLGKIEMARVPIFGWIYARIVVMLDRSSKESREASVGHLKQELSAGTSILVFPEGTMNRTNEELAEFYDGAFRIAVETGTPILPFVMLNTKKLLPAANILLIRPGLIKVCYGMPISVVGMTIADVPHLKELTRQAMYNMIRNGSVH